jgi:two-component system, LytTR family, response regulator
MIMAKKIRALVVDDEPLARERIRALLESEPDIEYVGECANGREAITSIEEMEPDLVFLDVQMPVVDGLGVVEAVGADKMPAVIFVTAYDRYALRAFEVHALDYLLKPFDRQRFQKALQRVRQQLNRDQSVVNVNERLVALLEESQGGRKPLERLVIKNAGRVFFVKTEEIDWIEAASNYVRLHVGKEAHLLRETMNSLESRMDPQRFLRIHRSTIVNIERIQELQPWFHGDYVVILRDGTQLTLSRGYRQKLQELFGNLF